MTRALFTRKAVGDSPRWYHRLWLILLLGLWLLTALAGWSVIATRPNFTNLDSLEVFAILVFGTVVVATIYGLCYLLSMGLLGLRHWLKSRLP